jgi:hypothetical protein
MAKKSNTFDERAFLEAMSQGHRFVPKADTPAPAPAETPATTPRRSREKVSDYEATFLVPREAIEKRVFVGLRPELYEVIQAIVRRIGRNGVSTQAFVENVLRHHLAEYQDEINRLNREKLKKDIL